MIGYNVDKINELMTNIAKNYKELGQKMSEGWSGISSTMESEWIGPDEVSYETALADNICKLYLSCKDTAQGMVNNVQELGRSWKQFQEQNIMEGAVSDKLSFEPDNVNLENYDFDIAGTVKPGSPNFTPGMNMGLKQQNSGQVIDNKITEYVDAVYTNVKSMYEALDSSQAFLGSEQNSKINDYLHNMGAAIARLTTCHKDIKERLIELTNKYNEAQSTVGQQVGQKTDEISTNVNYQGQNLK